MDPLSDVLSLLRPRGYMFRGFDAAGAWSLRFPVNEGIRCYAVVSGECWLMVDSADEPVRLAAGDCVLLTGRQAFCLASDPDLEPSDAVAFISKTPLGGIATLNGGGELSGLGGFFNFEGKHADVLLAQLPPVIHIRKDADRTRLRWSMETIMQELREPELGGSLMAMHLSQMMLVLALRLHLANRPSSSVGWLYALSDKQLGPVIGAMHGEPAKRWTLESLAALANMSRSTFAQKFKEAVGEPPMEYLARWRMLLAGDKLLNSNSTISEIASAVGYESDSAFGAAFRRVMGCSPGQYARPSGIEMVTDRIDDDAIAMKLEAIRGKA